MRTGAALHVVLFQLAVRARVALSAAPFSPSRAERGCQLRSCVSASRAHRRCTPCSCVSAFRAGTACTPCSCFAASRAGTACTPCTGVSASRDGTASAPMSSRLLDRHGSLPLCRNKPRHALRATVCSTRTAESSFEVTFRGTSKADLRGKQKPKTADPPQSPQKIASQDYGCQEEREDGSQNAHSETSPATRTSRKYTRIASSQQGTWRAAIRTQEVPEGDVVSVPGAS